MTIEAVALLVLGALGAAIEYLRRKRAVSMKPVVSEDDFIARLGVRTTERNVALALRKHVGSVLGIPAERLDPDWGYSELSKSIDFLGSFSVAWSDLEFELLEECQDAGVQYGAFETIGDYIRARIQLLPNRQSDGTE